MGNQKEAIKYAPKDLKPFLEGVIKNHKFTNFRADLSWNKSKTKNWVINCDLVDVNAVLKFYSGRAKKDQVGGRKLDLERHVKKKGELLMQRQQQCRRQDQSMYLNTSSTINEVDIVL